MDFDSPPPRQDEELREFFVPFGTVEDAVVIMERDDPGRSRGFGFVTYATAEEAAAAVEAADGQDLQGRALRVNVAEEKSRGGDGGGRGGPGGGPQAADQTLECRDCAAVLLSPPVTGPRRSLSLKLSDTRVYEPHIRARLGTTAHFPGCRPDARVPRLLCGTYSSSGAYRGTSLIRNSAPLGTALR